MTSPWLIARWSCVLLLAAMSSLFNVGRVAITSVSINAPDSAHRRLLHVYSKDELEKIREKWLAMRDRGEPLSSLLEPGPEPNTASKRASSAQRSRRYDPRAKQKAAAGGRPGSGKPPAPIKPKPPLTPAQAAEAAERKRLKMLAFESDMVNATRYTLVPRAQRLARLWEQLHAAPRNACVVCFHYVRNREGILTEGLRNFSRANHSCSVRRPSRKAPGRCDWWMSWGIKHLSKKNLFMADYPPMIVMDMANFRGLGPRGHEYQSLVWSGFENFGFRPRGMDGRRWEHYFAPYLSVRPWKPAQSNLTGAVVGIIGQMFHDTALMTIKARYGSPNAWYQKVVDELRAVAPGLDIRFRPHPTEGDEFALSDGTVPPTGATLDTHETLGELISAAYCLVTINSNAAIESILAGTPAIVVDEGSMAWEVAVHEVGDIGHLFRGDRTQWLHDLAYAQWQYSEIRAGTFLPIYFDEDKIG